jgi:hypothetical protein
MALALALAHPHPQGQVGLQFLEDPPGSDLHPQSSPLEPEIIVDLYSHATVLLLPCSIILQYCAVNGHPPPLKTVSIFYKNVKTGLKKVFQIRIQIRICIGSAFNWLPGPAFGMRIRIQV